MSQPGGEPCVWRCAGEQIVAVKRLRGYDTAMSTVHEIEQAIRALDANDFAALRDWFAALDAERWDRQLEGDVAAGRLDWLAEEALRDLREGRCTDL